VSTRPEGPSASAGFLLWRVQNRWRAAMTEALAPLGLTHVQFALLASLMWLTEEQGIEATQNDIAAHSGSDVTMTSQVLRSLEARKLITRKASKEDKRARVVTILAGGRHLTMEGLAAVRKVDAAFFDAVLDDPAAFRAELKRLANLK
jgi:DNA-binding MarR family transcriptional regulator